MIMGKMTSKNTVFLHAFGFFVIFVSMKTEYNSVEIARYIIALANDKGIPINMTKVQKLLYAAYGVFLAVTGERLLNEHPQAWPYGPVFPTTRNKLLNVNFYEISIQSEEFNTLKKDTVLNSLLQSIFNTFGNWTAGQLTSWSHQDGSPWEHTVEKEDFSWGNVIPDELIEGYFKTITTKDGGKG